MADAARTDGNFTDTAKVILPVPPGGIITESDRPLADCLDIEVLPHEGDVRQVKVGSGRYRFTIGS